MRTGFWFAGVISPFIFIFTAIAAADEQYPFQNPDLPTEQRIDNIISLMNLQEKVICLGTNPSVPRLGIKGSGHVEGLHGLAKGVPGGWGRPALFRRRHFHRRSAWAKPGIPI